MSNIVVLVVAAGSSSRMGSPKQLLKWKSTTLLGHTINNVKALENSKLLVVLGANFNLISPEVNQNEIVILNHKDWERGLGSSIAFGVKYIQESLPNVDGVLVLLADQPLIDSKYLELLINHFETGKNQIIASVYGNGIHGVPVLFDCFYLDELSLLNDDKGAKRLLHKYSKNVLAINAEHKTSDIDTIEDYERLYDENH